MKRNIYEPDMVRNKGTVKVFTITKCILLITLVSALHSFAGPVHIKSNKTWNDTKLNYRFVANNIIGTTNKSNAALNIPITGQILDSKGVPLIGVSVREKGTTIAASTDATGSYKLSVTDKNAILVFSYIGYNTQEVAVGNQTVINITLADSQTDLNEVVVVGYTTQKRSEITGAISAVKGSDLAKAPVDNITNSIAGQVSGVVGRQFGGGQPGNDNTTFTIRGINTTGNNSPLIVVDGIIRNNINQIDPNSIESVTILKDAAAVAPYGLGGANGVVLITTKTGQIGAPSISLSGYYGLQAPTFYPKVLNAQDYMTLYDEAQTNDGVAAANLKYAPSYIASYLTNNASNPDLYPIGDGRKIVNFKAPMQNTNMELSGGTDKIKYYTNLGFFNQTGIFQGVNYQRYTYAMGLEANVTNTTKISLSIRGAYEITKSVDAAISTGVILRDAYKLIPTDPLQFSNGLYGSSNGLSLLGALNSGGYNNNYNNTTLSTIAVEQKLPVRGLSIKGTFSYDPTSQNQKLWHLPIVYSTINTTTTPYTYSPAIATAEGPPAYTYLREQYNKAENFTYQGILNYHDNFGKNSVTGLLVAEARNNLNSFFNAQINNYSLLVDEFNFGSSNKNDYSIGGSSGTSSQVGYAYTLEDVFDGKYSLQASGRYDGHYYFAPGHQYAFFPAFSGFWNITRENFMKPVTWLNDLKLRASWGKSGSLAGGAFQFQNAYNLNGSAYAYGNGTLVQGTTPTSQANPNITWEEAIKTDIGIDATLFNNSLNVTVDVYKQLRSGMLYTPGGATIPAEYGTTLSQLNGQTMEGHGIELSIGTRHRFDNGLQLGANGTFSYNANKLTQVFETAATYNNPNRRQTGRPLFTQFGYHALGLFTAASAAAFNAAGKSQIGAVGSMRAGDIQYQDQNGDGKIDANDQVPIAYSPYPMIDYGLNLNASWKGFDVSVFFQGTAKSQINVQSFVTIPFNNNSSNVGYEYFNNRWTPSNPNPNAKYPIADSAPNSNNTQTSDYWIRNAAYVRLKTAQLGYTIPSSVLKALKIKTFRIYVSGQNLLTFSALKFMDPELGGLSFTGSGALQPATGQEVIYPVQRVISAGFNATF
jgi:TonB-linked SusC/RagA family outer membrane protein